MVQADNTDRYSDGRYLENNPDWHEDDSGWKFGHIERILTRNGIAFSSLCEIGCGTGAIVELAARHYPQALAKGFEISPQAYERCLARHAPNLSYQLGSAFDGGEHFDVSMAIDVIEHVEDPFSFVRSMRDMSRYQVFHIPLDMNALAVGRGWVIDEARDKIGHLHYFNGTTAVSLLRECGLDIVDRFYTPWAIDQSHKTWKKRLAAVPRRLAFAMAPDATVRLIGGWSLMVLTRSGQ